MKILIANALTVPLETIGEADAVYADPPYVGQEKRYDSEPTDWKALLERMEEIAPVRALSCNGKSEDIYRLLSLIGPERVRICAWVKNYSPWFKCRAWPALAWEPVLLWGHDRLWEEHEKQECRSDWPKPYDWVMTGPPTKNNTDRMWHPTAKHPDFCEWVVRLMCGVVKGKRVVELFAGSCGVGRAAESLGADVVAVEIREDYAMRAANLWDEVTRA